MCVQVCMDCLWLKLCACLNIYVCVYACMYVVVGGCGGGGYGCLVVVAVCV